MLELILAILLGIFAGTITGLIPGLHTNTIALIVAGTSTTMLSWFSPLAVASFLISMVVVHSFMDFIPSIFLGAPEDATVLSILPGHELLMQGKGFRALKLTIIGGVGTFLLSIFLIPIIFAFLEKGYNILSTAIAPILILFSIIFILQEKKFRKIFWAAMIFLLAGTIGLIVLNQISVKQPLFPLLSGLFGISTLFLSLFNNQKIPKQILNAEINYFTKSRLLDYFKAAISSLFVSILPAIGAAQAAVISRAFTKFKDNEDFLIVLGGINTAVALFTLTTLYVLGKSRTGVIAVLKEIITLSFSDYIVLLVVCFIAMIFGVILALKIGRFAAKNITKINYKTISIGVICFISILVFLFSGIIGLWILFISSCIGLLAPLVGVRRIHLMAVLVIPVVLYYW
jgi:putative membrane protein